MKALILAAGQGTRLRPHTDDKPKCMVPLAGVSLLDRQRAVLKAAGITDITIIAGYRANQIPLDGCELVVNPNYDSTNMVETLFCAVDLLDGNSDVILSYGDIIYEPKVLQALMDSTAPIALSVDKNWLEFWKLRLEDPLQDAETLKMDEKGHLLELGKKPESLEEIQAQYMGLIKIRSDQLPKFCNFYEQLDRNANYDGKDFRNMYMTSFIQALIDAGWPIQAVPVQGGWLEVDTVDDLTLYESLEQAGTLTPFCNLSSTQPLSTKVS